MMNKYQFKLFITGKTTRSEQAIKNLNSICEQKLKGEYEIRIIDILEDPQIAEKEKILATPTLIKESPLPSRRIIGDLSDTEKVLIGLDLITKEPD